jgi:hypothetical protein
VLWRIEGSRSSSSVAFFSSYWSIAVRNSISARSICAHRFPPLWVPLQWGSSDMMTKSSSDSPNLRRKTFSAS